MSSLPDRPDQVPLEAAWRDEASEWQLAEQDEEGVRHGVLRSWRADGSLKLFSEYKAGKLHGKLRRFHPNGELAREAEYQHGKAIGTLKAFASTGPTRETLRSCCVPPNAWSMRVDYGEGQFARERFYDREDRLLLPDGSLHPERPEGVPAGAWYDAREQRWVFGKRNGAGQRAGTWSYWALSGRLTETDDYELDKRHGVHALWADGGELLLEEHWVSGLRQGPYFSRQVEDNWYTDSAIHALCGQFEQGFAFGPWQFLDAQGKLVGGRDFGALPTEEELKASVALAPGSASSEQWSERIQALVSAGCLHEAMLAVGRAIGQTQVSEPWLHFVEVHTVALSERASEVVLAALRERDPNSVLAFANALLVGVGPALVFRAISLAHLELPTLAADFVEAAIVLAGSTPELLAGRGLIRVELGDRAGALRDAEVLATVSSQTSAFLKSYVRVLFPEFGFWPAACELIERVVEELPSAPEQALGAVRLAVQKYATRLLLTREAMRRCLGFGSESSLPAWFPPDVSKLLPSGPVTLGQWSFEAVAGEQVDTVLVDETLNLEHLGFVALMRQARLAWTGLTWVCFGAGMSEVGLPSAEQEAPRFSYALATAIQRYFRCRDQALTSGLRSLTQGVVGFSWEGLPIEQMPPVLLQMVTDEYLEMRAALFFLADESCQSPWQDDLRAG